jgi:hypothetical protein
MNIGKVIAGMGLLIAVYLVLSRGDDTAKIVTALASNTTSTIKALQGR